jgi:hypothetical protein
MHRDERLAREVLCSASKFPRADDDIMSRDFLTRSGVIARVCALLLLHATALVAAECPDDPPADEEQCTPVVPMLGTQNPVAEVQSFGVGATMTRARFEERSSTDIGVLASGAHFSYDTRTVFSGRSYGFGFIGGGSAGFEGGLGGELAFGLRFPFAKTHGPLARLAIEGFLMGNDAFYSSMLEVPKGEFGYQLLRRDLLLEAAVTAGPVVTGRFNVEGAPDRTLTGLFAVGGHVAVGFRTAHLELALTRMDSGDFRLGEFEEAVASLCGLPSVFAICADARYQTGGANDPEPDARVAYLGVRAGVVTSSQPAKGKKRPHEKAPR